MAHAGACSPRESRSRTSGLRALLAWAVAVLGLFALTGCPPEVMRRRVTRCPDEPPWVARGSGEFRTAAGKILVGIASAWQAPQLSQRQREAARKARECLSQQMLAYADELARRLARTHSRYFQGGAEDALTFFRAAGRVVAGRLCEEAPVLASWDCMITRETFARVGVLESDFLQAYLAYVEQLARARPDGVFGPRADAALRALSAELERCLRRKARGDLTR